MFAGFLHPIAIAPGTASATGAPIIYPPPEWDDVLNKPAFGTAAFFDAGAGPFEVPINANLGEAAYADIGIDAAEVATGNHIHAVEAEYVAPAVLTVVTGTLDSGTVTTLATKDGTDVSVSEVSGTPGFLIELEFHDLTILNLFEFFGRYAGATTHFVQLECYLPGSATWENYGTFGTSSVDQWYRFPIIDGAAHIDGSGIAKFRFYHLQAGVSSHDMFIDYARVRTGYSAQPST